MNALLEPRVQRRPMTVGDLDAVAAVEATAYSFPWTRGNFIDSLAAGYLAEVLVDSDQRVLGYFIAMTGVDELHLLNITIAPAWQGQGLGHGLMHAVQRHARERQLPSLWLEVRQSNERARALYRRLGFAEVGLRRAYYPAAGHREDAIVMSLKLPPDAASGGLHAVD